MNMKSLLRLAPVALAMGLASQTFAAAPVPSNTGSYYSSSDCSNLYTQKYDSTFAMTIKGAYGFNSDSDMPNIGGGMLSISSFIETEDLVHEISFTVGLFSSSPKHEGFGVTPEQKLAIYNNDDAYNEVAKACYDVRNEFAKFGYTLDQVFDALEPTSDVVGVDYKYRIQNSIPLLAGYNLLIPISANSVHFFLGAKAGVTFTTSKETLTVHHYYGPSERRSHSDSSTDFTFTVTGGFRFSVSETADVILAYELLKIQDVDPYHVIELGVSWNF
jgi:opacity protein-like surface antigen